MDAKERLEIVDLAQFHCNMIKARHPILIEETTKLQLHLDMVRRTEDPNGNLCLEIVALVDELKNKLTEMKVKKDTKEKQ